MCPTDEIPALFICFILLTKNKPQLLLLLKKISSFPFVLVLSYNNTYTLEPDIAICCPNDCLASLLKFMVLPKDNPPLVLLLKKISSFPLEVLGPCHDTYTLEPDIAICCPNDCLASLLKFMVLPKDN